MSSLTAGKGRAVRLLLGLAREQDVGHFLWPRVCSSLVAEGLRYEPSGVAEIIALSGIGASPYLSWLSSQRYVEEGNCFHEELVRCLVEQRVPGVWVALRSWLLSGQDHDWLLRRCCDLLPAPLWVELFEKWPMRELEQFIDFKDPVWLRVSWLSDRVRSAVADVTRLLEGYRVKFDRREMEEAARSSARFAFLRDALLSGDVSQVNDALEEGLWDISIYYREDCVEFADLAYGGVLPRIEELAKSSYPLLAFRAARRLRELAVPI